LNFFESKKNEARRRGTYERDLGQRLRKRQESSSEAVSAAMENSLSYVSLILGFFYQLKVCTCANRTFILLLKIISA
jgi:hypothetical protein